MSLSFKNRIAFHYMTATALVIALVFATVFCIVYSTVMHNVDGDLSYEANKHITEVRIVNGEIGFEDSEEWEEREHHEIEVNPVFVQLTDEEGKVIDRSPNLKKEQLNFHPEKENDRHFSSHLMGRHVRQLQLPVKDDGQIKGYVIAAMSLEPSLMVIEKLMNVLLISYPIILFGLFFISRYLAGRSIIPVKLMRDTTDRITRHNLNERVLIPANRDELYGLSTSINELLQRIEDAMERERQFTSDASHELRTPLSVLRGTLEVLIRKPRTQQEYEQKVKESLAEIDRLAEIMEQLLVLARVDAGLTISTDQQAPLNSIVEGIVELKTREAKALGVDIILLDRLPKLMLVPKYATELILSNLISNAIKYGAAGKQVIIDLSMVDQRALCSVKDHGVGIKSEDIPLIFNPFFRSDALNHRSIKGIGLGLAIAQKTALSIGAVIEVKSEHNKGSVFTVRF